MRLIIVEDEPMSYYRVCPLCGAALDPGELCDCKDKEEAAQGVSSTQSGKADPMNHQ